MNPQNEAVKDSEEYKIKRNRRHELETKFTECLKNAGQGMLQMFEEYLDAYADEQEILLEEMYLLGALDRERMLRGMI